MPNPNCPEGGGFTGSFVEKYDDVITKHNEVVQLYTDTQLKEWEAEAARMTTESFAAADIGEFVKVYTSNGDGTFKEETVNKYSAHHWGNQLDITQGNIADVATVEDLVGIDTNATLTAIVRDKNRGGIFVYDSTRADENDGGTVFDGWVRQYSGAVNVKWFGAKGDGITDDTLAIQNAINQQGVIEFESQHVFLTKELLLPETDCYIKGNNATLKIVDSEFSAVRLTKRDGTDNYFEGKNIVIDGLKIECNNQTNGIDLRYAIYDCEIKNCVIFGSVLSAIKADNCWTLKISNNTITSGKYNLWLGGANGVVVHGNRFMNADYYGIKCTVSELTGENNRMLTIEKNVIEYSKKSAIHIDASKIIDIRNNYIEDCAKEYTNNNAYIEIADNGNDIKTINVVSNVLKDSKTSSYTWAIKSNKCILLNVKNNVFDHFNYNLFYFHNTWEINEEGNDFFGLTNSVIEIDPKSKLLTSNDTNLFLNNGLLSWQKSTDTNAAGYSCVDNIYINNSGATVQSSRILLDVNEFSGASPYALKLNCTAADDNWGAFIRCPLSEEIFNNWVCMSVWAKADVDPLNVELSSYIKINNNISHNYLKNNRITLTTEWKLHYISFRVYDFIANIDPLNGFITMNIIHTDNSIGTIYIANPIIKIGRIPSTFIKNKLNNEIYRYIESMEVGTVNGGVRYSFSKKNRDINSLTTTLGSAALLGSNSLKLNHTVDDDIAKIVIDAQWL